jgi:hypothetical protein
MVLGVGTGEADLAKPDLLMTTLSLRLAFALSIAACRQARSWPAATRRSMRVRASSSYSLVISGATVDRPTGTISSIRIGAGGRRSSPHPYHSNDSYNPFYRRPQPQQQVYESIKPPAPRKVETPPAETVLVIGDSLGEWLAYGLELYSRKPRKLALCARSSRI